MKINLCLALMAGLFLCSAPVPADAMGYMGLARSQIGQNPTGWSRKWCAKWLSDVLVRSGKRAYGNVAYNPRYGRPSKCRPGAIAVMRTHVALVTACHGDSVSTISGNHAGKSGNRTVGPGRYRMSRIVTFRMP